MKNQYVTEIKTSSLEPFASNEPLHRAIPFVNALLKIVVLVKTTKTTLILAGQAVATDMGHGQSKSAVVQSRKRNGGR